MEKAKRPKRKRASSPIFSSRVCHRMLVPQIAIIGRPNVGKSTLFNRILGTRAAIVDDSPGVTRDRNVADCAYQNRAFQLVDTGGLDPSASDGIVEQIKRQSQAAIEEADLLLLTMDGRTGLTPLDEEIVSALRGIQKPVYFAVNKIDTPNSEPLLADFYKLGQESVYPVSAEQGTGVDELLEAILPHLPLCQENEVESPLPCIAVVGRPNVGKSTLVNTILGQERLVVSEQPGTTRDSVDTRVNCKGRSYILTDTAGIRRRGKIDRGIEGYSVARAIRALGRSDVAILLLDGVEGVTEQDTKIAGLIQKQGRGCLLLVNKWDLKTQDHDARGEYLSELTRRFPFLAYVPVVFGSAKDSTSIEQVFAQVDTIMTEFSRRIPTGRLNQFLQRALEKNPIPFRKGRSVKSVFMTQVATKPPTFAFFLRNADDISSAYLRYLENSLREQYGFLGTPIRILARSK